MGHLGWRCRWHAAPACGVGPHRVGESGLLVDGDVVGVAKSDVARHRCEHHRPVGDLQHLGQVHHLHAVVGRLADDERVVVVHLDVPPEAGVVAVGTRPTNKGFTASVTSTMDNPSWRPNNTNSRWEAESTHPQQSLPLAPPPNSSRVRTESKSSPEQGYPSAKPSTQGVWAKG